MKITENLKLATQLAIGFSVIVFFLGCLGSIALISISRENKHVDALRLNRLPSVESIMRMQADLRAIRLGEYRAVVAKSPSGSQDAEARANEAIIDYRLAAAEYEKLITEPEEIVAYKDIQLHLPIYLDLDRRIRALVFDAKLDQALDLIQGKSGREGSIIERDIKNIVDANIAGAVHEGDAATRAYAGALSLIIGLFISAVLVAGGVAFIIVRSLTKKLGGEPGDAGALASEIAGGNLRAAVRLRRGDNSSLMFSLADMKDRLSNIVSGIQVSSESISTAADEVAQGSADLSRRTEEQAGSLEETASSMEELASTVRQNADAAKSATALTSTASAVAQRGGKVVKQVVETMSEIADSSNRVSEIISVVEGIAFQTNILALNAAVEAARAGEQGRGFAVVAGEVRTLAQRSALAAKEIKDLIEESGARVDVGSKLVEDAGNTIKEIVVAVNRVAEITNEIATASEAQSVGIGQVSTAVTRLDEITQQNAALVEAGAAAAGSLAQQVQVLLDAVAVFNLDKLHAAPRRL